jgi:hypothetical protein
MPDLSLKNLDESLMRDVRVAAARSDMTLRGWVIAALIKSSRGNGKVECEEAIAVREATRAKPEETERPGVAEEESSVAQRPFHDPKVCRIYGCLMCKAMKNEKAAKKEEVEF